ncbi:MAG: N-formylglutamate amidohydrolase [Pseudomonadota bacterium]
MTVASPLLSDADPAPVEVVPGAPGAPVVFVCEHAGRIVPNRLKNLGVVPGVLNSHRGWDIGAVDVARQLASLLDAPLVLQRYSRLVIDSNRPPNSVASIPEISDGETIPGNVGLSLAAREARIEEIFAPMDRAIDELFEAEPRRAGLSIHSFTPNLGGLPRPWHAGFLSRRDPSTAKALHDAVAAMRPDLTLGINEPYQIEDETDWFVPRHAETRGLRHCLIEIRNDQLPDEAAAEEWADLLAQAIRPVVGW